MEAECFSGSCPQKVSSGLEFSEAIKRESPTTLVWKKKRKLFATFYNFQSRCKKAVTLLIVGSHVNRDTKFW